MGYDKRSISWMGWDLAMNETQLRQIAQGWIILHNSIEGSEEHKANFHFFEKLSDMIYNGDICSIDVIRYIFEEGINDKIISNLAAGPLEDLLIYLPHETINFLKDHLDNKNIKSALDFVWKNSIDDDVWETLCNLKTGKL